MTYMLKVMREDWSYIRKHGLRVKTLFPIVVWLGMVVVLWGLVISL